MRTPKTKRVFYGMLPEVCFWNQRELHRCDPLWVCFVFLDGGVVFYPSPKKNSLRCWNILTSITGSFWQIYDTIMGHFYLTRYDAVICAHLFIRICRTDPPGQKITVCSIELYHLGYFLRCSINQENKNPHWIVCCDVILDKNRF